MNLLPINKEVSERLREFIKQRFPARGRFKELEAKSGIGVNRWQNFFYGKQEATQELLQFWVRNFEDELYPNGVESLPEPYPSDDPISNRLRLLISQRYPERGRFALMEADSGISLSKWKSLFYKKQNASQEIMDFWCKNYPDSKNWLLTGKYSTDEDEYPFMAPAPNDKSLNIGDRLVWVIREYASPHGEDLYQYLFEKSQGQISIDDWSKVIQKKIEPTIQMLEFICKISPKFTLWLLTGKVIEEPQVDPDDKESINRWSQYIENRTISPEEAARIIELTKASGSR